MNNNNNEDSVANKDTMPTHEPTTMGDPTGQTVTHNDLDPTLGVIVDEVPPPTLTHSDSVITISFRNKTHLIDTKSQLSRCVINLSSNQSLEC